MPTKDATARIQTPEADVAMGRHIRILREARGLGQRDLAERLDVGVTAVGRMERGEGIEDIATLRAIAAAIDTTPGRLLDGPASRRMIDLSALDDQSAAAIETLHAALSRR